MPAQFAVLVAVGQIEGEGGNRAKPAQADAAAVMPIHVGEVVAHRAHVVKQRQREVFADRFLIFEAGYGQGAVGQHRIIRAFQADTVLLVATHAVGTAAAKQ